MFEPLADELTSLERVCLDIDTRIAEIWELAELQGLDPVQIGPLLRWAYGRGYSDGTRERGSLAKEYGYKIVV